MTPQPKIYGFKLPSSVDDGSCVSVTLQFPNILEYRAAFNGQINMLGKWFQWAHTQADYQNIPEVNKQVAELWCRVLADASWSVCMSFCEQMIACLLTDTDVQAALAELIASNETIQQSMRDFIQSDQSMRDWSQQEAFYAVQPGEALATNFGDVPDCNPDNLFAVTTVAVNVLNDVSEDIFEVVALGVTAAQKAEKLVAAIPLIGGLLPFDEIIGLAADIVGSFQTSYLSSYNETLEDELRCGLFCIAKPTCDLTIADMITFYENKLGHSLPGDIIGAAGDIANFLVTGSFPGESIVYGMHLLVLAMIRGVQNVAGVNFADLALRLVAAADETNNDWAILCEDCPPDPENCEGADFSFDFRTGEYGWIPTPVGVNYANYHAGQGWGPNDGSYRISIDKTLSGTINKVRVYYNVEQAPGNILFRNSWVNGWSALGYTGEVTGTEGDSWYIERTGMSSANGLSIETISGAFPSTTRLTRLCVWID